MKVQQPQEKKQRLRPTDEFNSEQYNKSAHEEILKQCRKALGFVHFQNCPKRNAAQRNDDDSLFHQKAKVRDSGWIAMGRYVSKLMTSRGIELESTLFRTVSALLLLLLWPLQKSGIIATLMTLHNRIVIWWQLKTRQNIPLEMMSRQVSYSWAAFHLKGYLRRSSRAIVKYRTSGTWTDDAKMIVMMIGAELALLLLLE